MMALSDQFIEKAQSSLLATIIPRDKIPEFLRLAASGKTAVVHLLNPTGKIIEITEDEAPAFLEQLKSARAYIRQVSPDTRYSIVSTSTASSASSQHPSLFSVTSGHSFASTNTGSSLASAASSFRHQKKPRSTPTSWARLKNKQYLCPTCGVECKRSYDFKNHVENHCEIRKVLFSCNGCQMTSEDQAEIRRHRQLLHPEGIPTEGEMSLDKVARGCAFCASVHYSLHSYIKCMQDDQAKDRKPTPKPAWRLIALWRQNAQTQSAIIAACERRKLPYEAWTRCTWDDDVCDEFSTILEYGCYETDDVYKNGVAYDDLHQFADDLMARARWENTNLPVDPLPPPPPPPPPKDNALRIQVPHTHVPQYVSNQGFLDTNGARASYHTPTPPPQYHPIPITMGYAESEMQSAFNAQARHEAEQRTARAHYGSPTPKRHPSLESTIHPESSARAKRTPQPSNFTSSLPLHTIRPDLIVVPNNVYTTTVTTGIELPAQHVMTDAYPVSPHRPASKNLAVNHPSNSYRPGAHTPAGLNGSLAHMSFFDAT